MPPVIIVGLSLGGMIGLQLAFDRPEMVQGVMMVSTLGGIEVCRLVNQVVGDETDDIQLPPVAAGRTQIAELWATHMETRAALNASHPGMSASSLLPTSMSFSSNSQV